MKKDPFTVGNLLDCYGEILCLTKSTRVDAHERIIETSEVHRPGLSLAGYTREKTDKRILLFGLVEIGFLEGLEKKLRVERLKKVITKHTPLVIVTKGKSPPLEIMELCKQLNVSLFTSQIQTSTLLTKLTVILAELLSPVMSCHGTLVETFGMGVLIKGDSSIGKSEAALGLIEKGHRLISDDVVHVSKRDEFHLIGKGPELNRHLLEIRGIGIVNVANLYGAVCVRDQVGIEMIIHLEEWNDNHYYDRIGLEEKFAEILEIKIPSYTLPVKPGRDIVLLLETTILNHHLKKVGYHSAKEFNLKLLEEIAKRQGARSAVK